MDSSQSLLMYNKMLGVDYGIRRRQRQRAHINIIWAYWAVNQVLAFLDSISHWSPLQSTVAKKYIKIKIERHQRPARFFFVVLKEKSQREGAGWEELDEEEADN